jgi:hypothetical protein
MTPDAVMTGLGLAVPFGTVLGAAVLIFSMWRS